MRCEFRARLVAGAVAHVLLDKLLAVCRERELLTARGRQRTDSTHVLAALRVLSRLELVAETLRAALAALAALAAIAATAPGWAPAHLPTAWVARSGRRIEEYRLPRGKAAGAAFATTVGVDGQTVLALLTAADAPPRLRDLTAVQVLRQGWEQQFAEDGEPVPLGEATALPASAEQVASPHEPEARFAVKRELGGTGDKAHLTETVDDDRPHLITQGTTTLATATDFAQVVPIQADLARPGRLPGQHVVDGGDVSGRNLVTSHATHAIDLLGPMVADHRWPAKAGTGFAGGDFQVDGAARVVTCPAAAQACAGARPPPRGGR